MVSSNIIITSIFMVVGICNTQNAHDPRVSYMSAQQELLKDVHNNLNDIHLPPFAHMETMAAFNNLQKEKGKSSPKEFSGFFSEKNPTGEETGENILQEALLGVLPEDIWSAFQGQTSETNTDGETHSLITNAILKYLRRLYLPDGKLINNQACIDDLKLIYSPAGLQTLYVTLLLDSWGKLPDGFFSGNTQSFGSFDECLSIHFHRNNTNPAKGSFHGQYCTVGYSPYNNSNLNEFNTRTAFSAPIINAAPILTVVYAYGTCIPATCTEEDLSVSIAHHLADRGLNLNVSGVVCQTSKILPVQFTPGAIVFIVVLAVEGTLILLAGILDVMIQYTGKEELRKGSLKYLLVFSFYTNLEKMFHLNTSESKEAITCLHGIRVLSMTWVVMGHQYAMWLFAANKSFLPSIFNDNFAIQMFSNAYPSVDTFFFMSGLLVAYSVLREQERTGKFNIVLFYVHRVLRLSPPILLFCGFLAVFQVPLGRGPLAPLAQSYEDNCRNYWYRDAFFFSNFHGYDEHFPSCLVVSWYTSVDTQLYLVAPILLLPFIFKKTLENKFSMASSIGILWLSFLTLLSVVIPAIITGVNRLPPNAMLGVTENLRLHSKFIYTVPWCRAAPYMAGICLAYLLRQNLEKKIKLQMWQVMVGWLMATGLGVAVVFGMYRYDQFAIIEYNWTMSIFYGSLHPLAWGIALAWVVFACHNGYGGPINSILSHPSWQPLSRLSYCMFLIALSLQEILTNNLMAPFYYSHLNKIIETVGVLFISGIGAVLLSLYTEGPILGLEKHILRK